MYTDKELYKELNRLIDLQITDIKKSLNAEADVLCLVGCMNLIEFLGGVRSGKIRTRGSAEKRFKDGVQLLGERFANERKLGADTMWNLRNALIHQYIPEAIENNIGIFLLWGSKLLQFVDDHAIRPPHYKTGGRIPRMTQIVTRFLIADLGKARKKLIEELEKNEALRNKLRMTFWWMPKVKEQDDNNPFMLKLK